MKHRTPEQVLAQRYVVTGSMQNQDLQVLEALSYAPCETPKEWALGDPCVELLVRNLKTHEVKGIVQRPDHSGHVTTPGVALDKKYMEKVARWRKDVERLIAACDHVEQVFNSIENPGKKQ